MKLFDPSVFSREAVKRFNDGLDLGSMTLLHRKLEPGSVWVPTNETYDEALSWAHVLEVEVRLDKGAEDFIIFSRYRAHRRIRSCSPQALIAALKEYCDDSA